MIVISANQLTKLYGVDEILKDVSFHINAGDRVGIVGANGAGKSTLLNILSGELTCDSGNYFISTFSHRKKQYTRKCCPFSAI